MLLKHRINSFLAIAIIAAIGIFATVMILHAIASVPLTSLSNESLSINTL